MIVDPMTLTAAASWLSITKDGLTIAGFGYALFKIVYWVRDKLTSISKDVLDGNKKLEDIHTELKVQTAQLVSEQKETRQDMKTFLFPALIQAQATIRAKPKAKPKAKKKPLTRK
jgi:hypothetical protein